MTKKKLDSTSAQESHSIYVKLDICKQRENIRDEIYMWPQEEEVIAMKMQRAEIESGTTNEWTCF